MLTRFLTALDTAAAAGNLLKCTLSRPGVDAPDGLKNVYIRPVMLKKGLHLAFTYRYKTRDEVKNFAVPAAIELLATMLGREFFNADLLTTAADWTLSFDKNGAPHLQEKKPAQTELPDTTHNREKQRLLDPAAPWLHALGITSAKGDVLAAAQDKWRQINKYLEIIDSLLRTQPLPADARIADMGSGKGYLTFALYDFLTQKLGLKPQITGIELRPNLVELCNKIAQQADFQGLTFVAQDIANYHPERLDMLIALHACDTATDLALATGIHETAQIIVAAPCCHKQIRKEMHAQNELAPVLRHGILEERQAEIVTDGIRALLLEANGYRTQVFEFISSEHTAKNVMITALHGGQTSATNRPISAKQRMEALEKVAALKTGFGIREHYLEKLLQAKTGN